MTREEKQKAIDALKISAPVMAITQEEFNDYIQTLNNVMDWLEQESTPKNDLGVDCISRQDVLSEIIRFSTEEGASVACQQLYCDVNNMPSVTPQERKGHWVKTPKAVMGEGYMWYCDKCEYQVYQDSSRDYPSEKYCPNCGSDNRKVSVKIVNRGKCMLCGKELTEGLFFCKECEAKAETEAEDE